MNRYMIQVEYRRKSVCQQNINESDGSSKGCRNGVSKRTF